MERLLDIAPVGHNLTTSYDRSAAREGYTMAEQTHLRKTTFELHKVAQAGCGEGLQVVYSPESGVVLIQADVCGNGWATIAEMTPLEFHRWVSALDRWASFIDKV